MTAAADGAARAVFADAFWPPADLLSEAAERILSLTGARPEAAPRTRICLAAPQAPEPGDLRLFIDGALHPDDRQACLRAGSGVIEATPDVVRLTLGAVDISFSGGARSDDWVAALAVFLRCGYVPADALALALAWREPPPGGAWPENPREFPAVLGLPPPPPAFPLCPLHLGLYPVVPDAQWVERLLALGVRTLQLRIKTSTDAALRAQIARAVEAGRDCRARVFINDHWRIAIELGAYGVHLGQEDLQDADLTAISAAGLRLGLSSHGYAEMLTALHFRPSYIAVGPIFATATKVVPAAPQGLVRLERYVRFLERLAMPAVAIGGIDAATLGPVLATGVASAAVVRAVTGAPDLAAAVAALEHTFRQAQGSDG